VNRWLKIILVTLVLLMLLPLTVSAVADDRYNEGFYIYLRRGTNEAYTALDLNAVKEVRGSTSTSILYINYDGPGAGGTRVRIVEQITLPGDPDWLEVSADLGWAGLDRTVWMTNQTTGQPVRVRIHVDLYATSPTYSDNAAYFRRADVQGWVRIDGRTIGFDMPNAGANFERGTIGFTNYFGS
jgi:hypothetical protein